MESGDYGLDDEQLVSAVRAGDKGAFERIVGKYYCTIYSICFAHVRHRETAEELGQEVILRIYLNMGTLKSGRTLAVWAGQIARNLSRDWLRRGQTRSRLLPLVPLELPDHDKADPSATTARRAASEAEEQRLLDRALEQLPADQREVVLLHYAEGLSKSEIARRLGVFPSSVGRRLERALGSLKLELEPRLRQTAPALRPSSAAVARGMIVAAAVTQLSTPVKAAIVGAAGSAAASGLAASLISPIALGGIKVTKAALAATVLAIGSLAGFVVWNQQPEQPVRAASADLTSVDRSREERAREQVQGSLNGETSRPAVTVPAPSPQPIAAATSASAALEVAEAESATTEALAIADIPDPTTVTMRLLVRDWSSRKPVADVEMSPAGSDTGGRPVNIRPATSSGQAASDGSGSEALSPPVAGEFLIGPVQAGDRISLRLKAPGYTPMTAGPFRVPAGAAEFKKTVRMAAVAALTGRVVQPGTDTPVADVKLTYQSLGESATAVTGADGRFTLKNIQSGNIRIKFAPKEIWPRFARDFTTVQGVTKDVGDIEVSKIPSSIRGRVIRMPGEQPVVGYRVELTKRDEVSFKATATTDGDGVFEFRDLANAAYIAWVLDPRNHDPSESDDTWLQAACFQQITLGTEENRDLVLRIGGVKLRGRVTKDGYPVRCNIHLSQGATGYLKETAAQTDADGRFELKDVCSGWWLGAVDSSSPKGTFNDWFLIPETEEFEYEFILPSGKVTGLVQGPDGTPVADARVFIVQNDTRNYDVIKQPVAMDCRSRADGTFTLPASKGKLYLRARKDGTGQSWPVEVDVPESGETAPVALKLEPTDTGSITSIALDYADGNPVKKAGLNLYDKASRLEVKAARDEDGVMTLTDLLPGDYRVLVSCPGYSVDEKHVTVKPGETAVVESVLYEGGTARIVVQDSQGEFQLGVRVELTPEDRASIEEPRSGVTLRGGLVMARGLTPGGYVVKVETPDGRTREETIRIRAHEITDRLIIVK